MGNTSGKRTTSLVILNRNDVEGLEHIYPKIPLESINEVIVIDGQSTDSSVQYCTDQGINVIVQKVLGRGDAFRLASSSVKGDYIIFLSSDGNENPDDIPQFIHFLDQGYDLVIASRLARDGRNKDDDKLFPIRKWALQAFSKIVSMAWKSNLTDVWNGYRAFRTEKLKSLPSSANGHVIELEQTIKALKLGYKVTEFPTIEGDRVSGKTRNPLFRTGVKLTMLLLKELFTATGTEDNSEY